MPQPQRVVLCYSQGEASFLLQTTRLGAGDCFVLDGDVWRVDEVVSADDLGSGATEVRCRLDTSPAGCAGLQIRLGSSPVSPRRP